MNHKGVLKTAPATLGPLTRHGSPVGIRPNQCNPIFGNVFKALSCLNNSRLRLANWTAC